MSKPVDLLLLSLGTTRGLRIADAQFAEMARQAGASVELAGTRIGALDRFRRGYPANDLVEALAARRALRSALSRLRPGAVVFSTTTASLLAGELECPFAVWLDSPARLNRPGMRNAPLHLLERRQLGRAKLVLVQSEPAIAALPNGAAQAVVISPPIEIPPPRTMRSDPLVVAYTPDPKAKDLELVVRAWAEVRAPRAHLQVTGIAPAAAREFLARCGITELPPRLELAGMLAAGEFHKLLYRTRVFLSAARWEDFGMAPLEALARGAVLVGAPAGGPFPALAIARELAPRFVAGDRAPRSIAHALDEALSAEAPELSAYQTAARDRLRPYRERVTVKRLRESVLPQLLA
jgi:glycosyltransferase involved in cell wall biosynthesis